MCVVKFMEQWFFKKSALFSSGDVCLYTSRKDFLPLPTTQYTLVFLNYFFCNSIYLTNAFLKESENCCMRACLMGFLSCPIPTAGKSQTNHTEIGPVAQTPY